MKRNKNKVKHLIDGETERTAEQLRSGLEHLDQLYPVNTPNLEWFEQMTLAEKKRLRRKLMYDLAIFWFVAVVLLSVYLVASNFIPAMYFVLLQVVVAVFPTIYLLSKGWRSRDEPYRQ